MPRSNDPLVEARRALRQANLLLHQAVANPDELFNHTMKQEYPGFTAKDALGDAPTNGYMVSQEGTEDKTPFAYLNADDIGNFGQAHADEIAQPGNYQGGWKGDDGQFYQDISQNHGNPWEAAQAAEDGNQIAMYDLNPGGGEVNTEEAMHELFDHGQPGYRMARHEY